jgi:small subunit ribosomal protein S6
LLKSLANPTLTPTSEDTRIYECCVLYPYPFGQKEESDLQKEIEGLFAEAGAKMVAKDKWGRRGLAYTVGGFNEGSYIVYYFEMDPSKLKEIDTQLRIMKGVLRHLFVKPPKHYQILKYSEVYEQWLKERSTVEERRDKEREEKLKEQVAKKAKRQAQRTMEKKKEETAKPAEAMSEEAISEKLDKLISDDTIDL